MEGEVDLTVQVALDAPLHQPGAESTPGWRRDGRTAALAPVKDETRRKPRLSVQVSGDRERACL